MTKLRLTKECDKCDGSGWLHNLSGEDESYENKYKGDRCPNCDNGKTVMEFVPVILEIFSGNEIEFQCSVQGETYRIRYDNEFAKWIVMNGGEEVLESLNPLYLEVIEEQEGKEILVGKYEFYPKEKSD